MNLTLRLIKGTTVLTEYIYHCTNGGKTKDLEPILNTPRTSQMQLTLNKFINKGNVLNYNLIHTYFVKRRETSVHFLVVDTL